VTAPEKTGVRSPRLFAVKLLPGVAGVAAVVPTLSAKEVDTSRSNDGKRKRILNAAEVIVKNPSNALAA
jgi:hypothetical protein